MIYLLEQDGSLEQRKTAQRLLLYGLQKEYRMQTLPHMEPSAQGKPYFPEYPEIRFNYSHSRQGILCGLWDTEIGVDIERLIPWREKLVRRICHERERALLRKTAEEAACERLLTRIWTAKESYLKCVGTGIRVDLCTLDFSDCILGWQGEHICEKVISKETYCMAFSDGPDYGTAICVKSLGKSRDAAFLLQKVEAEALPLLES